MIRLGFWDVALLLVVSVQGTFLAALRAPRWKALVLALPLPFTLATLAVGTPVTSAHVAGMIVLLGYTHAVRGLHYGMRMPIVPAIALSAAGYALAGALLRPWLPATPAAFWLACVLTVAVAAVVRAVSPRPSEPGHRTPLPVWVKFPLIAGVVFALILIKRSLQGFTAMFPMVGVIAAYESRHSLRTVCRTLTVFVFAMTPMVAVVYLAQQRLPMGAALALGWAVFLVLMALLFRRDFGR
jgi:hypothetical protein